MGVQFELHGNERGPCNWDFIYSQCLIHSKGVESYLHTDESKLAKAVDCVIHVTLRVSKIDSKYRATRLSGCIGPPSRSQDNSLAVFFNSYSFLWGYNIGIASMQSLIKMR